MNVREQMFSNQPQFRARRFIVAAFIGRRGFVFWSGTVGFDAAVNDAELRFFRCVWIGFENRLFDAQR